MILVENKFYDLKQLSAHLSISKNTLYYFVKTKQIPVIRIGKLIRFSKEDIEKWIEEKKVGVL